MLSLLGESTQIFRPFSALHLTTVALCAVVWTAVIGLAQRSRRAPRLRRFELVFAAMTMLLWMLAEGYWLVPSRFDVAYTLPLHLCDIVALLVPLGLWLHRRSLFTLVYFWGIGLSLQAVLTPALHHGPAHFEFWLFWSYHTMILAAAVYFVVVRDYRPRWRDYRLAVTWGAVYLLVVFPIDVLFGFNYGFVGDARPSQPSLIDHLGPWPWRVLVIAGLALVVLGILLLPWELSRARSWRADPRD